MNNQINVHNLESNRLINSAQAAEYLGYKVSYIYNLVYNGRLKAFKCGNKAKGSLRFLKSDLDKYLGRCADGH
jgi:excisionase family DNA binding protein